MHTFENLNIVLMRMLTPMTGWQHKLSKDVVPGELKIESNYKWAPPSENTYMPSEYVWTVIPRSDCASVQCDQGLCCPLKNHSMQ